MVPCHIYGIWRSRGGGRFEVIWGVGGRVAMQVKGGTILMGKEGEVLTICNTAVLKLCYWVRFYRIPPFPKFLLFHLFLSTEIGRVKSAS